MLSFALLIGGAVCLTGCSHSAARHRAVQQKLQAHSQALTTAVVDTLELEPSRERSRHAELALALAREDQRIEGLPPEGIEIEPLLADPTGLEVRAAEIARLLAREARLRERLMSLGVEAEERSNARRAWWSKWIASGTVLIGGGIALCVFFPVAIPIFGRVLGWMVGKVPSLARALGVVSLKAFDAVVRGVEKSRAATAGQPLANQTGGEAAGLDWNLGREMDREHKRLVRARKAALNL
jgi:hypothetical protein